jgi:hypothetical protein
MVLSDMDIKELWNIFQVGERPTAVTPIFIFIFLL